MAHTVTHQFVSAKSDGADTSVVRPSDWNAAHTVTIDDSAIDHGSVGGLSDDDHTQYHNDSRALTWLGTRSTTDLPEGTNEYYTDAKADARVAVHTGDATDAHDASAISFSATGNVAATDVQAAIEELDDEKQPLDAGLTDIAALAVTDGNIIVGDGANWVAESGSTARASLGLTIGTHVQAYDAGLDDISGLAVTDGNFIVGNGTNWVAESGSTARGSLGLGSIATQDANNVSISGGSVTGITDIAVADGGTGASDAATARENLDVPHDLSVMYANRLINGEFRIWQRGTSLASQADDSYGAMGDRWYILTQTDTIAGARQADPFDGATHSGQLTQSQASAQRIGVAQIIEGKNCKDLRGQAVTFYGRFKVSADQDIRFAILENTGTEDTVTSDVVNDWTSTTYTTSNFFAASATVTAVKEYASPGTGWVDFFVTGTVGTSCDNLIVVAWTEGTLAQNETFSLANCGLVRGSAAPAAHTPRPFTQELRLCQRYYFKTFPLDTTPAQNAGSADEFSFSAIAASTTHRGASFPLPVDMRAAPTLTTYSSAAASAEARDDNAGALCTGTSATVDSGTKKIRLVTTTPAGTSAGNKICVHISAVAEL